MTLNDKIKNALMYCGYTVILGLSSLLYPTKAQAQSAAEPIFDINGKYGKILSLSKSLDSQFSADPGDASWYVSAGAGYKGPLIFLLKGFYGESHYTGNFSESGSFGFFRSRFRSEKLGFKRSYGGLEGEVGIPLNKDYDGYIYFVGGVGVIEVLFDRDFSSSDTGFFTGSSEKLIEKLRKGFPGAHIGGGFKLGKNIYLLIEGKYISGIDQDEDANDIPKALELYGGVGFHIPIGKSKKK